MIIACDINGGVCGSPFESDFIHGLASDCSILVCRVQLVGLFIVVFLPSVSVVWGYGSCSPKDRLFIIGIYTH